ncbi:YopX family protein [Clostridium butyricum]|uniref:YopX family protein n=1 Tax=Clostridium butyricum TaxID=1492 RepID=UPI002ABDD0BC|nr:YopX family protein [Clostridium butyricum]
MNKRLKFKIFNDKTKKMENRVDYAIDINGEGVQSFDRLGVMEGTLKNRHLIPIQYTERNDMTGKEIYDGYIIKREYEILGGEDITGVVESHECAWWIVNYKEQRAERLFDETALDIILGNKWENKELMEELNVE